MKNKDCKEGLKSIIVDLIKSEIFNHNHLESKLITLQNDRICVQLSNYGARVVSLWTADRKGVFEDLVLGCDTVADYFLDDYKYMGATIGRYANRISKAKFSIDNIEYKLAANENENILHGGLKGYHAVWWKVEEVSDTKCVMSYLSKDGEEGFPGDLRLSLTFEISDNGALDIICIADASKPTPLNISNHTYFNLSGNLSESILNHRLKINADSYLPVDDEMIPLGNPERVGGTAFDFRELKKIGQDIKSNHPQILRNKGYDHSLILDKPVHNGAPVYVEEPISGRCLSLYTNQVAVQLYTANEMDCIGKKRKRYKDYSAFCLESQYYPDSPNNSSYPSTLVIPGKRYIHSTKYLFGLC